MLAYPSDFPGGLPKSTTVPTTRAQALLTAPERRQRRARCSSGYVPCLLRLAAAATQWPGSTSARGWCSPARQRRHKGGIEGESRTVPQGEPVGDHFNPPVIGDGHVNVHVRDTHIPRNASPALMANARDRSFERRGEDPDVAQAAR